MKQSFEAVEKNTDPNKPLLVVLRGFTEIINQFDMPSHWERFQRHDLSGNDIRYIHAEALQILLWSEKLYQRVEAEASSQLANCNVVHDGSVVAELYDMSLDLSEVPVSITQNKTLIEAFINFNYQFIYLDFNIFDTKDEQIDYFPINYETMLGEDFDYFETASYYGYLDYNYHGQGIIQYYELPMLNEDHAVKIFKGPYVNELLDIKVKDSSSIDFYEVISDAVFLYLAKINDLS